MEPARGERASEAGGLARRLLRTLLRVVGGGASEPTDPLLRALRTERDELLRGFAWLAATTETDARRRALAELGTSLSAHAKATREAVHAPLCEGAGAGEGAAGPLGHAAERLARVEELASRACALGPDGSGCSDVVAELERQVRAHLAAEEALAATVPPERREELARAFEARAAELRRLFEREGDAGTTERPRPRRSRSDLAHRTVRELYAMAREEGLEGRSRMSKEELIAALGASEER